MTLDEFLNKVEKHSTSVYGLKYFPSVESFMSNDSEIPVIDMSNGARPEVTDNNRSLVLNTMLSFDEGRGPRSIMEIGVNRNHGDSITQVFINNKIKSCVYLGVDIDDKSFLNDSSKNIFTIQSNSNEQSTIRSYLKEIGIDKLDILFIDGWHSVNMTVNDWKYADLLSDNGVVIIHDTNFHPGDVAILDAIDENIFEVNKYFTDNDDHGMAIVRKK